MVVAPKVQPFVVWAILNSTLMNWYAHRFVFGKAIRTMHFDNAVTERIPMPNFKAEPVKHLKSLSEKSLELQKQLHAAEENSNEWERLTSEISQIDRSIDEQIYKFYDLTEEEIKIIDTRSLNL